jgi:DNA invertase Pin-like site-specific DNA recombinase
MEDWKEDPNDLALVIVRRSSQGQEENTSAETQEREIRDYCKRHNLKIVHLEPIIETAFNSEERKKYNRLMTLAQEKGIKHILFYIGSREARNLTDNERNERLIKEGKIIIHHVSDGKVYWKGSPDSDFLARDLIVAVNKNYSRENGTKMKAAYKTKAENGWWPYRHTVMGYVHHKDKDKYGNAIKGTAKIAIDPDVRLVQLVQREFELRADNLSYDEIRKKNIEADIIPLEIVKKYSRKGIEARLKNPFYWGHFYLYENSRKYQGKHELIIPSRVLKAVEAINNGQGSKRKRALSEQGVFADGWLRCGHIECQRQITYDPKKKKIKNTGEEKTYHLYRCSNSRKVHASMKGMNISEEKIWGQLEPAVAALSISEQFAQDITNALNETQHKQKAAIKKQMEGFRLERDKLRVERNNIVSLYVGGKVREVEYNDYIEDIDGRDDHFANEIERLTLTISDEAMASVKKVFELAINAKARWKDMTRLQQVEYLKKVCSNPTLDGLTVQYQLQKPFARLAIMKENSDWRRG